MGRDEGNDISDIRNKQRQGAREMLDVLEEK